MKSKLYTLLLVLIIFLLILTACGLNNKQQSQPADIKTDKQEEKTDDTLSDEEMEKEIKNIEEEYKNESQTKEENTVSNNYAATSPFTGLPITQKHYKRAVAVSIENSPAARPQSGLNKAEIVYEFMLEGGITRFLALFWPELPNKIGPIRSARPALIKTANAYDALFLHAGASPDGFALLSNENILHLDQIHQSKYFWRSSKKSAPHNLYSGYPSLKSYLNQMGEKEYPDQFNFLTASVVSDFKKAENISIDYWGSYKVLYEYNSLENNYSRFLNKKSNPHQVESGSTIKAKNIIVQYSNYSTKDAQDRQKIDLNSGGNIKLFRDGMIIDGSWENKGGRIRYYNNEGQRISINPGKTWIQVVPSSTEVNY